MTTERSRRDGVHVTLVLSLYQPTGNLELCCWTRIRLLAAKWDAVSGCVR